MLYSATNTGHADLLSTFLQNNGRWPQRDSSEHGEHSLFHWWKRARQAEAAGVIAPALVEKLDTSCPGWRSPRTIPWNVRLQQLADFVDNSAHFPSQLGEADESALYRWLYAQRKAAADGRLTPSRRRLLDSAVPLWQATYEVERHPAPPKRQSPWKVRLDRAVAFHELHHRFPDARSSDPDERNIARWLREQRRLSHRPVFSEPHRHALDTSLPGWHASPRNSEGTEQLARRLGEHYRLTGKWPYRHDISSESRRLERWHRTQRSRGRGNLPDELVKQLDHHAPGWDATRPKGRADLSVDPSALRTLYEEGASLAEVARAANMLAPTARHLIIEAGGSMRPQGPRPRADARSLRRVIELEQYILTAQQWPQHADPDATVRSLEQWLQRVRRSGREHLHADLTRQLDEHAPGWDAQRTKSRTNRSNNTNDVPSKALATPHDRDLTPTVRRSASPDLAEPTIRSM